MPAPDWFVDAWVSHYNKLENPERLRRADQAYCDELWDWLMPQMSRLLTHWQYQNRPSVCITWPWTDEPGAKEARPRYWNQPIRGWLYSDADQVEIRKRFPDLPE